MLAYLRLAYNPRDDISFKRCINVPPRGIGPKAISILEAWATKHDASLYDAAHDQEVQSSVSKQAGGAIRSFVDAITAAQTRAEQPGVTAVLKGLMNDSGYLTMLKEDRSDEATSRLENLQEFLGVAQQFDSTTDDEPTLGAFLESVSLVADIDNLVVGGNAVTLMTLHSAKGLEFPIVFLAGLEEGVFPHSRSLNSDAELEEERRLAYVGMTRAQKELHLSHAHRRSLYGMPSFNPRSRFIENIPAEILSMRGDQTSQGGFGSTNRSVHLERRGNYTVTPPLRPDPTPSASAPTPVSPGWKPPFTVGDRVRHSKFGVGVVISCAPVRDDAEVTVAFPGVTGVKKLVQKLAQLELVK